MSGITKAVIFFGLALLLGAGAAHAQSWTTTTPLSSARDLSAAVTIGDWIYLVGGRNITNMEAFDTRTSAWSVLPSMPSDRAQAAVGAIDGKIYVAGGLSTGAMAHADGMVYDTAARTWATIAPMPVTLATMSCAVANGQLFVFSGASQNGSVDSPRPYVYSYAPTGDTWTRHPDMPRPRKNGAAVELGGRIYVVGGLTNGYGVGGFVPWVDVYDPTADAWCAAPDLPAPVALHALVASNGRIWAVGGISPQLQLVATVYSYRPGDPAWRVDVPLPAPLGLEAASTSSAATIYTFGGDADPAWAYQTTVYERTVHEPDIVSITDVPNDQGGRLSIRWIASNLDANPADPVDAYWIWRQVPAGAARAALANGAGLLAVGSSFAPVTGRTLRSTSQGADIYYWEYLGSQVAHAYPGYSFTAATLFDSIPGSNPRTLFMVEGEHLATGEYWSSAPDSGYSMDNLAPAAPAALVAHETSTGATRLSWPRNAEADVAGYRVYLGAAPDFKPGPLTLVATPADTVWALPVWRTAYYKVAAVDVHGNEGAAAAVATSVPPGGVDEPGAGVRVLALAPVQPNPTRGGSSIGFSLARDGEADLTVLDAQGRVLRTLARGPLTAGPHAVRWDGVTNSGARTPAGLYFVRLVTPDGTRTRRLVTIH